ncbi:TPA: DUF3473 domain-containing protein [Candidatus Poribacteria bacterium]|nr:DUF3473 domain-containing protein [Candidatus Poribacteria bacterium]
MKHNPLYFVMTVDVDPPPPSAPDLKIDEGILTLLQMFKKNEIKSTFFVTAIMAEKFPDLMQKIKKDGHEIACHDLDHSPMVDKLNLTRLMFRIRIATQLIEDYVGVRPYGYRAPLFKINRDQLVALNKNGYVYDSSIIFPPFFRSLRIFFSKPFFVPINKNGWMIEIPLSTNPMMPFPIGGAYFRVFGEKWAKAGIKVNFLFKNPLIFYIHPKDIIVRTSGPSWYSYKNTSKCLDSLKEIINYAKKTGAIFIKAIDLAYLFAKNQNFNDKSFVI